MTYILWLWWNIFIYDAHKLNPLAEWFSFRIFPNGYIFFIVSVWTMYECRESDINLNHENHQPRFSPASWPLRSTAGQEIFSILVPETPAGRPVGGGGIHRNQKKRARIYFHHRSGQLISANCICPSLTPPSQISTNVRHISSVKSSKPGPKIKMVRGGQWGHIVIVPPGPGRES